MSQDKDRYEALRWLETSEEDLEAARLLSEKKMFSHACFMAQQCGEKAIKALWFSSGEDPWGHSIQKLIMEIPDKKVREQMENLLHDGALLDRYYISTRYPNGLPDLTPGKVYFQKDAETCLSASERILKTVKEWLGLE